MSITSVAIANAVLATPFSKDGRMHMRKTSRYQTGTDASLKEDFLSSCYVDADFISSCMLEEKLNSEKEKALALTSNQDYDHFASRADTQRKYKYSIRRRSEEAQKISFETDLLGINETDIDNRTFSSVFLIEGPAGCGKTTYANHLLREEGGFQVDMCDVETATQKQCRLFEDTFQLDNASLTPINAIEILLISTIHKRLSYQYFASDSEQEYMSYLKTLTTTYFDFFNSSKIVYQDSIIFQEFFTLLNDYAEKNTSYKQLTIQVHNLIKKIHNIPAPQTKKSHDEVESIRMLIGIIIRIYFCLGTNTNKKYILFLDNIERYIISEAGKPYIAIYDNDIQRIINSIYSLTDETEDLLDKIYEELSKRDHNIKYHTTYGIVIAVRESTLDLLKNNQSFTEYYEVHHSEKYPTCVNISNWFDFQKVFCNKIKYFLGENETIDNYIIKAFNNILNDVTASKWSLRNLLLNIFNNNYRRFFANLTEAFCSYENEVKFYNAKWESVKSLNTSHAQCIKHLCRKLILRVVLNYMQNTTLNQPGFFDALMARCETLKSSNDEIAISSCARRMLTYLDNVNRKDNTNSVQFPELIKTLFHRPMIRDITKSNVHVNDHRIKSLASIMTTAGQTAKIHTNGVELVAINIDCSQIKNTNLSDIMTKEWNNYRISGGTPIRSKCNIKISPAGSVIAMICPSFEYFACRYCNNTNPLFMLETEAERYSLLFGSQQDNPSQEKKVGVIDRARNCIEATLRYESRIRSLNWSNPGSPKEAYEKPLWLYDYDGEGDGMVHALRIISDHVGYLRDYKNYLAGLSPSIKENEHYVSKDGLGVVDKAINVYLEVYNNVLSKYRKYLEVGNIPNI